MNRSVLGQPKIFLNRNWNPQGKRQRLRWDGLRRHSNGVQGDKLILHKISVGRKEAEQLGDAGTGGRTIMCVQFIRLMVGTIGKIF